MSNPLRTHLLTAEERLDEVARLMALGFLRLRAHAKRKKPTDRTI